jgi:hypothetical protein
VFYFKLDRGSMRGVLCSKEKRERHQSILALAACSAFFSCAPAQFRNHDVMLSHQSELQSSWSSGQCRFSGNSVTYSDISGAEATLRLDVRIETPQNLLCSQNYSVIVTPTTAVVALGANDIFSRHEMMGYLGSRFIPANSIEISLSPIIHEGGFTGEQISRDQLSISAKNGRLWIISLSNPFEGWNII